METEKINRKRETNPKRGGVVMPLEATVAMASAARRGSRWPRRDGGGGARAEIAQRDDGVKGEEEMEFSGWRGLLATVRG
ncbi:unnamed protein product [Linum trigynum]|uniref:Uncharacterized protein n=1 Tax=Linum trigynum TaxID=586398 RepID=A0AAV2CFV8_9ROSI